MRLRPSKQDRIVDTVELSDGDGVSLANTASDGVLVAGSELLFEGSLLAGWFILHELEKEMQRAKRHERHLSILVLTPVPSLGHRPDAPALEAAAIAARQSARTTDLVGWLPDDRILVVLPETDRDGAAAATHRWRTEMYTSTLRMGPVRWVVTMSVDPFAYGSAKELIDALTAAVV